MVGTGEPVATGDTQGTSWLMYGPGEGEGRLEEGRGVEEGVLMREWPVRRRGSGELGGGFG